MALRTSQGWYLSKYYPLFCVGPSGSKAHREVSWYLGQLQWYRLLIMSCVGILLNWIPKKIVKHCRKNQTVNIKKRILRCSLMHRNIADLLNSMVNGAETGYLPLIQIEMIKTNNDILLNLNEFKYEEKSKLTKNKSMCQWRCEGRVHKENEIRVTRCITNVQKARYGWKTPVTTLCFIEIYHRLT